jgi:hypothetical protein
METWGNRSRWIFFTLTSSWVHTSPYPTIIKIIYEFDSRLNFITFPSINQNSRRLCYPACSILSFRNWTADFLQFWVYFEGDDIFTCDSMIHLVILTRILFINLKRYVYYICLFKLKLFSLCLNYLKYK